MRPRLLPYVSPDTETLDVCPAALAEPLASLHLEITTYLL